MDVLHAAGWRWCQVYRPEGDRPKSLETFCGVELSMKGSGTRLPNLIALFSPAADSHNPEAVRHAWLQQLQ
jgi:hypothetical protein